MTAVLWIVGTRLRFLMDSAATTGLGSVTTFLYSGIVLLAQQHVLARPADVLAV